MANSIKKTVLEPLLSTEIEVVEVRLTRRQL
jgi:hypothetical protein